MHWLAQPRAEATRSPSEPAPADVESRVFDTQIEVADAARSSIGLSRGALADVEPARAQESHR